MEIFAINFGIHDELLKTSNGMERGIMEKVNALDPARMTAEERLEETADILAAGIRRLLEKKAANKNGSLETICLDKPVPQSLHGHDNSEKGE